MRNQYKKKSYYYILYSLLLLAAFFVFYKTCLAIENPLIITEIMYSPLEDSEEEKVEWIEMIANNDIPLQLKSNDQIANFYLCAKKPCSTSYALYATEKDLSIKKNDFLIFTKDPEIFKKTYPDLSGAKIIRTSPSFNLLENSDAFIAYSLDNKTTWLENISYADFFDKKPDGHSLEKIDFEKDNTKDNWQESFALGGTPSQESSKKKEDDEKKDADENSGDKTDSPSKYSGKVKINEIFPAPVTKNGEEEFVEIINDSGETIDFSNWTIKDSKETTPKISKRESNGKFYVFYGTFSLNNDKNGDAVFLYDDKENIIDSKDYHETKSEYSYAFDNSAWQWTSKRTPGAENEFDQLVSGKIIKDKNIYKNTYANFEAKADKHAKKFIWDFGDGHKSYLQKTRHKYAETGDYAASLKITGDGKDNLINFSVTVEDYPHPKIKIIKVNANPKGSDSLSETLILENQTKKKINLKNWSVATGWKTLANHPINNDFIFKPKETKILTREFSAFTLGNAQAKIELRYPDGEVADKVKYNRKKDALSEDEVYAKEKSGWIWIKPETESENSPEGESAAPLSDAKTNNSEENDQPEIPAGTLDGEPAPEEISANFGKISQENKPKIIFLSAQFPMHRNQSFVLGTKTKKPNPVSQEINSQKDSVFTKIARKINLFLVRFLWI